MAKKLTQREQWRYEQMLQADRKRASGMVRIAGWIPRRTRDKLRRIAKSNGLTLSQVITQMVKDA